MAPGLLSRALTDCGFQSVEPCGTPNRGAAQVDDQREIENEIHDRGGVVLGDDVNQGEQPQGAKEPWIEPGSPSELVAPALDQSQQRLVQRLIGGDLACSECSSNRNAIRNPLGTRGSLVATTHHCDEDRHGGAEQQASADSPG